MSTASSVLLLLPPSLWSPWPGRGARRSCRLSWHFGGWHRLLSPAAALWSLSAFSASKRIRLSPFSSYKGFEKPKLSRVDRDGKFPSCSEKSLCEPHQNTTSDMTSAASVKRHLCTAQRFCGASAVSTPLPQLPPQAALPTPRPDHVLHNARQHTTLS